MSQSASLARARQRPASLVPAPNRLLQRMCSCGSHSAAGGECEECAKQNRTIQRKLAIGPSTGPLEQEADRLADQVLPSPIRSGVSSTPPRIHRSSSEVAGGGEMAPPSVERVLTNAGQPLGAGLQEEMEQRFGNDFSRVRIHTGGSAEQSAREVNAQAYTVEHNIVFGAGRYAPGTHAGRRLVAHELGHVMQQFGLNGVREQNAPRARQAAMSGTLQRTPAAPVAGTSAVPFNRSKIDLFAIPDIRTDTSLQQLIAIAKPAFVKFNEPAITSFSAILFDPADQTLSSTPSRPVPAGRMTAFPLFTTPVTGLKQGRHLLRCVGFDGAGQAVAYADRTFYVWTSAPTGKPPDIAALQAEKTSLEAITKKGSGKTLGEVGGAFTKLKDVSHDLAVLETGTGVYVGNQCAVAPAGAIPTDCTNIVLEVLENTFVQQGQAADWAKVKRKMASNTKARGGKGGLSGVDVQAALQSEAGWKGIYWAPDPAYQVPQAELSGARSDEAGYTAGIAKRKGTYMKDFGKKGYPGVTIHQSVTNYAPETPTAGTASTTTKDTTQLAKLKKLPFGVLSAHGGYHMTLITYGKVIEVHWDKEATNVDLIQQTDLERWAVGPHSGYHYYASGAIVAPAADVDAAFKATP